MFNRADIETFPIRVEIERKYQAVINIFVKQTVEQPQTVKTRFR